MYQSIFRTPVIVFAIFEMSKKQNTEEDLKLKEQLKKLKDSYLVNCRQLIADPTYVKMFDKAISHLITPNRVGCSSFYIYEY